MSGTSGEEFVPGVDERTLEVYARASNPHDPMELRDLWLGRVEHELGSGGHRRELADRWRATRTRRQVDPEEVLGSRATARFVKELFNWFFRDDLYGELRPEAQIILSGGAVDEQAWGLPDPLKQCIHFALDKDWYGYSDPRGRVPVREAVASYENARIADAPYDERNVALTMGGTFAINTLADFILLDGPRRDAPALCGIPNYPPLVEAIARRGPVRLVGMPSRSGFVSVDALIGALTPGTPLVMLQIAANPTGAALAEDDLERLIRAAAPSTIVLLDECHDWLGPTQRCSRLRAASNVVRVSSLSKTWSAPGLKAGWLLADSRFIDAYYEYASTSFGGPPSFLYTMVEVLARMERWLLDGLTVPGAAELAEFESCPGSPTRSRRPRPRSNRAARSWPARYPTPRWRRSSAVDRAGVRRCSAPRSWWRPRGWRRSGRTWRSGGTSSAAPGRPTCRCSCSPRPAAPSAGQPKSRRRAHASAAGSSWSPRIGTPWWRVTPMRSCPCSGRFAKSSRPCSTICSPAMAAFVTARLGRLVLRGPAA